MLTAVLTAGLLFFFYLFTGTGPCLLLFPISLPRKNSGINNLFDFIDAFPAQLRGKNLHLWGIVIAPREIVPLVVGNPDCSPVSEHKVRALIPRNMLELCPLRNKMIPRNLNVVRVFAISGGDPLLRTHCRNALLVLFSLVLI